MRAMLPPTRTGSSRDRAHLELRHPEIGSSASLVSRLALPAPAQWNGMNTVSGRIVGGDPRRARRPRRGGVVTRTGVAVAMPSRVGQQRVQLDERLRRRRGAAPAPGGSARRTGTAPAPGRSSGRAGTSAQAPRPPAGARPGQAGPAVRRGEAVGEQARRARVRVRRRAGPEDAVLGVEPLVADAGVVGRAAGGGAAQLVEDLGRVGRRSAGAARAGRPARPGSPGRCATPPAAAATAAGAGSPGPRGWSSCPSSSAHWVDRQDDVGERGGLGRARSRRPPGGRGARAVRSTAAASGARDHRVRAEHQQRPRPVRGAERVEQLVRRARPGPGSVVGRRRPTPPATCARAAGSSMRR